MSSASPISAPSSTARSLSTTAVTDSELGIKSEHRTLLSHVKGLELVEMAEAETCCGFGGTFAVKYAPISTAMDEVKCASILETGAGTVVSNDSSCLMQIRGMLEKEGSAIRSLHLAEILASK